MSMNNMLMGALKEKEEFTQTYNYTGGAQSFSIPSGIIKVSVFNLKLSSSESSKSWL